jgi:hypothetical protein
LPQGSKKAPTLLELAGLNINDSNNILRLPNKEGASLKIFGKATIHAGKHSKLYVDAIDKKIDEIIETGRHSHFYQEQYRSEVYKLIDEFKSQLISGDIKLNSVVRPK